MLKKFRYFHLRSKHILYLFLALGLLFLLKLLGSIILSIILPIKIGTGKIDIQNCHAEYSIYSSWSEKLCNSQTGGHCQTTDFNRWNAESEVGRCLCQTYLDNPSKEIEMEILKLVNESSRRKYFDLNYPEETLSITNICKDSSKVFYRAYID